MTVTETAARECTADEASLWHERFSEGYRVGRGDAMATGRMYRDGWLLAEVPAELPGETGAQYVARLVSQAREIGYTRAWQYYSPI